MNILDLNEDIMSKVKHNIFLRKIMNIKKIILIMKDSIGAYGRLITI